jgi:hypothetical protein
VHAETHKKITENSGKKQSTAKEVSKGGSQTNKPEEAGKVGNRSRQRMQT